MCIVSYDNNSILISSMTHACRVHGGPDTFGVPVHDFSTNSNACGPCPQALAAVNHCDVGRYPDPAYTALKRELAAFHGVEPARVLLAGSASEFIFRMTAWAARQGVMTVRVPRHAYGDYAEAAHAWAMRVTSIGPAGLHWYTDPSSPLGQSPLDSGVAHATSLGGDTLVLDRAYEPLRLSGVCGWTPAQLAQVWQLWTPNKALGLTGVRGAYAIAPLGSNDAVAQLDRLCPSWPLGAHGVALLNAWVQPSVQVWLAGSLDTLKLWKARQIAMLDGLGWACLPSHANFLCAQPVSNDLEADVRRLRRCGIKLRNAASFGMLGHVRLAVLPPAAQDALQEAWPVSLGAALPRHPDAGLDHTRALT